MGYQPARPEAENHAATRRHLLEAAAEVFAEVGFRAATVRQICRRAGANIAAVNYHFGDKEHLYRTVLKTTLQAAIAKYPPDYGLPANATPEQRLEVFIRSFLLRIFSKGPSSLHGKLMVREMIEPTGALEAVVKENIRPMSVVLMSIVGGLLGRRAGEQTKHLCAMSVVSQVLFYHHCRPVVAHLFPAMKFDEAAIEHLTAHITRFSLAAMKQIAREARK